jgi:hypothetical protein
MPISVPHMRRKSRDHAPDVKARIVPAAVGLLVPRDASQHGVVGVVVRDPRGGTRPRPRARLCLRPRAARSPGPGTPGVSASCALVSRKTSDAGAHAACGILRKDEKAELDVDVHGTEVRDS